MFGNKDDLRQKYCDIYARMQADDPFPDRLDQMIANVITMHPEYQPLLADSEKSIESEFGPDQGQANPFATAPTNLYWNKLLKMWVVPMV